MSYYPTINKNLVSLIELKNVLENAKTYDGIEGLVNSMVAILGEENRSVFNNIMGGITNKKNIQETR